MRGDGLPTGMCSNHPRHAKSLQSCPILCDPWTVAPPGSSVPGKNTGVGCHVLLQGIFLTQGGT